MGIATDPSKRTYLYILTSFVVITTIGVAVILSRSRDHRDVTPGKRAEKTIVPTFAVAKPRASRATIDQPLVPQPDDWFETVTPQTGIDFAYRNGMESGNYTILESLGGGVAMIDYDGDGDLDLLFTGGGTLTGTPPVVAGLPLRLYENTGGMAFTDRSSPAGLGGSIDYSHGVAVGDYDCDGFPDLFVCCYGRSRFFHNMGDGCFEDETETCGLKIEGWRTAAVWADVDHDGFSDLYAAGYVRWSPEKDILCRYWQGKRDVCSPRRFPAEDDVLFRNRGDGTFEDFTKTAGLKPGGTGLGVVAADVNADGWIDLYVANDETNNLLYLGGPDGKLREVGEMAGVATNEYGMHDGSMGLDIGDLDGNGLPEIWMTNFQSEDNVLFRNMGNNMFSPGTTAMRLAGRSRPHVGFGTGLVDFDGDGMLDIYVANGHVFYHVGILPYQQPAQLFRNREGKRFDDISQKGGVYFRTPHVGRGAAAGDLDNDGAPDLVFVHQNEPVEVLRNNRTASRFVRVALRGRKCSRDAVGAVLSWNSGGRTITRHVRGGAGYFSHSDQRLIVPLAGSESVDVNVVWPGGGREVFRNLRSGRDFILVQGRGEYK